MFIFLKNCGGIFLYYLFSFGSSIFSSFSSGGFIYLFINIPIITPIAVSPVLLIEYIIGLATAGSTKILKTTIDAMTQAAGFFITLQI